MWGAMVLSPDQRRRLLDAARHTIRHALRANPDAAPTPCPADPALHEPAGCFVSLHEMRTHRLRGCVGRIEGTQPLWQAVARAAAGVLSDPRFVKDPVRLGELPDLSVEISVLSPMRVADSPLAFDPAVNGIYLTYAGRSGCFLPQVARDTGWSREQLLARLCTEKLGLPPTAWQDPAARLLTFSTMLIGPEPFDDQTR
jgi:AmmeMemoRadiSam system protein A